MYLKKKPYKVFALMCVAWVWGSVYWYDCHIKNVCSTNSNDLFAAQVDNNSTVMINELKEKNASISRNITSANNRLASLNVANNKSNISNNRKNQDNMGIIKPNKQNLLQDSVKIYFPSGQLTNKTITKDIENRLNLIVSKAVENHKTYIEIFGHTDNLGSSLTNQQVSLQRAEMIKQMLVDQGVDVERIKVKGLGGDFPEVSNATREGRMKNRRVIIALVG